MTRNAENSATKLQQELSLIRRELALTQSNLGLSGGPLSYPDPVESLTPSRAEARVSTPLLNRNIWPGALASKESAKENTTEEGAHLESTRSQLDTARFSGLHLAELPDDPQALKIRADELNLKATRLEAEMEDQAKLLTAAREEARQHQAAGRRSETQLRQLRRELDEAAEKTLVTAQRQLEADSAARVKTDRLTREVASLRGELEAVKAENRRLEAVGTELQAAMSRRDMEEEHLRRTLADRDATVAEVTSGLGSMATVREAAAKASEDMRRLRLDKERLEAALKDEKARAERAEAAVELTVGEVEKLRGTLRDGNRDEARTEMIAERGRAERAEGALRQARAEVAQLRARLGGEDAEEKVTAMEAATTSAVQGANAEAKAWKARAQVAEEALAVATEKLNSTEELTSRLIDAEANVEHWKRQANAEGLRADAASDMVKVRETERDALSRQLATLRDENLSLRRQSVTSALAREPNVSAASPPLSTLSRSPKQDDTLPHTVGTASGGRSYEQAAAALDAVRSQLIMSLAPPTPSGPPPPPPETSTRSVLPAAPPTPPLAPLSASLPPPTTSRLVDWSQLPSDRVLSLAEFHAITSHQSPPSHHHLSLSQPIHSPIHPQPAPTRAGLGMLLHSDTTTKHWAIVQLVAGGPAASVGEGLLAEGDVVLAIDGTMIRGEPMVKVTGLMLGPPGTLVALDVQRGEEQPRRVIVSRAPVNPDAIALAIESASRSEETSRKRDGLPVDDARVGVLTMDEL